MVLSYSDAAFITTSSFPVNSQSIHPFITLQSDCYLPANTPLSETPIEELSLFIPLKAGVNEVVFELL
jgi:hypothetical protein